ncbi:hypothetical protein ACFRMN_16455 [Streptomyces sp. NPDC056835]|uniref:hypothetical protein n=1 Tax=Streptomyces sp. NPDC056835 TaxID=3345956 RepID=UPI00369F633B
MSRQAGQGAAARDGALRTGAIPARRASNPGGTTAMRVRDRLDGLWCDEDFAGRYPRDGRPGVSPRGRSDNEHLDSGAVGGRGRPRAPAVSP